MITNHNIIRKSSIETHESLRFCHVFLLVDVGESLTPPFLFNLGVSSKGDTSSLASSTSVGDTLSWLGVGAWEL